MYESQSIDSEILLKWCKLLEYDFFRIYTQHLILYSPIKKSNEVENKEFTSKLHVPRKNIYAIEFIEFILEQIQTNEKSIKEVINEYNIPKTTL